MEDREIIELYFARSEDAIAQTAKKYGGYLAMIAGGILSSAEDRDECVQDTYYRTWAAIPPQRPQYFRAWLGCLTRSISIDRWRAEHAKKRGGGEYALSLDELGECVPAPDETAGVVDRVTLSAVLDRSLDELADCVPVSDETQRVADREAITGALDRFLAARRPIDRRIFLQRYWYFRSVRQIARDCEVNESRVKVSLHRSRNALRQLLEEEGIAL